jgi:hypothetical protein
MIEHSGRSFITLTKVPGLSLMLFFTEIQHCLLSHSHDALRADAEKYADPSWNAAFYDSITPYVTGYVPTASRGTVKVDCTSL